MKRSGLLFLCLTLVAACSSDENAAHSPPAAGGVGGSSGGSSGGSAGGTGGGTAGASGSGSPTVPARDPLPCFADEGTAAGDALVISVTASRLSGVAPLAVFFDTDGTTSEATERPYHDLGYCWDFGDPESGNFATTGLSKNQAKGPVSGHVFEQSGTYAVKVSARDAQSRVSSVELEIEVTDPEEVYAGENTICFSGAGDFTGCPEGAAQVTASVLSALRDHIATNHRLLLRRGEVFSGDGILNINVPGPGTIGAFGEGDRPSIQPVVGVYDAAEGVIHLSDDRAPDFDDWRLMDVAIDEPSFMGTQALTVAGNARNILLLRVLLHGLQAGVNASIDVVDYWASEGYAADISNGLSIQDSELREISSYALYLASRQFLYLGNVVTDSRPEERNSLLRLHYLDRAVVSNSVFGPGQCVDSHLLYVPGPAYTQQADTLPSITNGQYARRLLFSDNVFQPGTLLNWSFYLGPQNTAADERFRDVLIERNLFLAGADAHQASIAIRGDVQDVTVRDNLFNQPQGSCVVLHPWVHRDVPSPEFVPSAVAFVHNTCQNGDGPLVYMDLEAPAVSVEYTDVSFANNLLVTSTYPLKQGAGAAMVGDGIGNLITDSAGLTAAAPARWEDFAPAAGSPAIDAADTSVWSPWDYSGRARYLGAGPDTGGLEYDPE